MKKKIIAYIKAETQKGHFPTWREIQNKFGINILHYFEGMQEIYFASGVRMHQRKRLKNSEQSKNIMRPKNS